MLAYRKISRALFSCNTHFKIRRFVLLPTKDFLEKNSQKINQIHENASGNVICYLILTELLSVRGLSFLAIQIVCPCDTLKYDVYNLN